MNEKHRQFAEAILKIDRKGRKVHTATSAYQSVYPSVKRKESAMNGASRLLGNDEISAYIEKRLKARQMRTEISEERVLKELAKMAFVNMGDLLQEDGSVKPISEIDHNDLAAVTGLDISERYIGGGKDAPPDLILVKKIKTGKESALEKLAKNLGLYEKDNKQKQEPVHMTMNFGPPPKEEHEEDTAE